MKTLKLLLAIALLSSCQAYKFKAHGKVIASEPYESYITHNDTTIRWELFEIYEDYHLQVLPGDEVTVYWISPCTADTLATAEFNGTNKRQKYNDTIYLDGSNYVFGKIGRK